VPFISVELALIHHNSLIFTRFSMQLKNLPSIISRDGERPGDYVNFSVDGHKMYIHLLILFEWLNLILCWNVEIKSIQCEYYDFSRPFNPSHYMRQDRLASWHVVKIFLQTNLSTKKQIAIIWVWKSNAQA
jgi:hypothetical protein